MSFSVFTRLYSLNDHCCLIQGHLITRKATPYPLTDSPAFCLLLWPPQSLLLLSVFPVWTLPMVGVMHYVVFCVWLLSLTIMFSRSMNVSIYQHFIPFYSQIIHGMNTTYFTHLFIGWWTFELFPCVDYCRCNWLLESIDSTSADLTIHRLKIFGKK